MAASGIAEHDEARRKEIVYLRRAWHLREDQEKMKEQIRQDMLNRASGGAKPSEYEQQVDRMRQLGMIGNINDPKSMERERQLKLYEQQKNAYSAKIENRYSSIDYMSQW